MWCDAGYMGGDEKCVQSVGLKTWRDEATWKTYIYGRIMLKWVSEGGRLWTGFSWIQRWASMNISHDPSGSERVRIFFTAETHQISWKTIYLVGIFLSVRWLIIVPLSYRSFCIKTGVQILLREYSFDSKNRLTFFEEDIINIFPVVKHINPRVCINYSCMDMHFSGVTVW